MRSGVKYGERCDAAARSQRNTVDTAAKWRANSAGCARRIMLQHRYHRYHRYHRHHRHLQSIAIKSASLPASTAPAFTFKAFAPFSVAHRTT